MSQEIDIQWSRLMDCLALAFRVHRGQLDKAGEPYICHCGAVGFCLLPDWNAACLGILHDILEDSPNGPGDDALAAEALSALGGHPRLLHTLRLLARGDQNYDTYIERIAEDPLAIKVKIADLRNNLDPGRLRRATEHGHNMLPRIARYTKALRFLTDRQPRQIGREQVVLPANSTIGCEFIDGGE